MSCIYDIFLVLIFTLFLRIQGGGGQCSPAKEAECEAAWRTCLNEQCGVCFLEINGECYNPNYDRDAVLERLENCDPIADPECKKSLEDVTDQLLTELGAKDKDVVKDGGGQLSIFTHSLTKNDIDTSETEVTQPRKPNETISSAENNDSVGFRSEETPRKTSKLNKKHPVKKHNDDNSDDIPDVYFLIIIIACTLSGVAGIALSGYCWYRLHYSDDKVNKTEYIPGKKRNGKSTPSKNGDRKLDYKAEMYHYVHTKNQIAAIEKAKGDHLSSGAISNDEDDDDDEVEDYTVYECPGLAPTGDMTVVNPLFSDQEISVSDEGRAQSNHSSPPTTPSQSNQSPSR